MVRWLSTPLSLVMLCAGAATARAQESPPRVLSQAVLPVYPPEALAAGIAGTVSVRITVDASGTVRNIEVLAVPREGVGFEAAVTSALKQWQFSPALRGGMPVDGVLELSVPFRTYLPGDFVFKTDPATAWRQVKALVTQLKYKTVRVDETHQYLVTEYASYSKGLPDLKGLGLIKNGRPARVNWYVSVPTDFKVARVSIASEVQVVDGRETYMLYRTVPLASWFAEQLAQQLTLPVERLASDVEERTRLSPPVSEATAEPCRPPSSPVSLQKGRSGNLQMPRILQEFKPLFPQNELRAQHQGTVLLEAVATEHGSMTSIKVLRSPNQSPEFIANAIAAAAMWRFLPARLDGCPVPASITIELNFRIR
jgi:TonB family protein